MNLEPTEPTSRPAILASRKNGARRRLDNLDAKAAKLIEQINRRETSLKAVTADMIAAGVQMAEIMMEDDNADAWDAFVSPFGIKAKGRDREYRQIAGVLFRKREGQPTTVHSQISRVGAAIYVAHKLFEKVADIDQLKAEIVKAGCIDGLSRQRRDQLKLERNTSTAPAPVPEKFAEIAVPIPHHPMVIVLLPDGTTKPVPRNVAAMVFEQMRLAP